MAYTLLGAYLASVLGIIAWSHHRKIKRMEQLGVFSALIRRPPVLTRRKIGGIWFVKLGRVNVSFSLSRYAQR